MFPRVMLSRISENHLDGGLHAVGPLHHAARDVDHRQAREDPGEEQVEHGLVEVQRADREPGVEAELVLRLELLVAPGRAEDHDGEHDHQHVRGEGADDDLGRLAHGRGLFLSIGRSSRDVAK